MVRSLLDSPWPFPALCRVLSHNCSDFLIHGSMWSSLVLRSDSQSQLSPECQWMAISSADWGCYAGWLVLSCLSSLAVAAGAPYLYSRSVELIIWPLCWHLKVCSTPLVATVATYHQDFLLKFPIRHTHNTCSIRLNYSPRTHRHRHLLSTGPLEHWNIISNTGLCLLLLLHILYWREESFSQWLIQVVRRENKFIRLL